MKKMSEKNDFIVGKLTKDEKNLFHALTKGEYSNFLLMKVQFQNKQTACICSLNRENNKIHPLAILINDDMSKNLLCPKGAKLENE